MAKDDDFSSMTEEERRKRNKEAAARLPMRDEDWDHMRGIRIVALLLKAVSGILVLVMFAQIYFTISDPSGMPVTPGTIMGEAVRLLAFAAFLWGGADLALMLTRSHHETRATRILMQRQNNLLTKILRGEKKMGKGPE
ncbi:MAG TPA: hypothetical protein VMY38_05855 [Gemmatimonadaceae bacterium]|nr:hypothetical protein [Gemmatimonadaceae bacterium]